MLDRRITCCVPFCKRSTRFVAETIVLDEGGTRLSGSAITLDSEWICQRHWSAVPLKLRRLHSASKRRVRKFRSRRCALGAVRIWRRCKAKAIEGAAGI
jgi:hypothetical protein